MPLVPHLPADEPTRDRTPPDLDDIVERIVYGDASSVRDTEYRDCVPVVRRTTGTDVP